MDSQKLVDFIIDKLEDIKAQDIVTIDVRKQTGITDYMVIASGTSTQHVRSIAQNLMREAKTNHISIIGSEGEETADWVLIDLADAVVHVMLPKTREYYELEKLWAIDDEPKVKKPKINKKPTAKKAAPNKRTTAITKKATTTKKQPAVKKATVAKKTTTIKKQPMVKKTKKAE